MSETMTGAEMVIRALQDQGVEHLFGYPGGAVLPIYDAIFTQDKVKHILVRHEQGAVHAAEGYARSSGKVGVVLVTSGPGATNAVTGLTDALMDSIPIVCITGQVPTHLIGNDAFQECDTVGITRPCTKHNYLVRDVKDLARVLHEAFYVARSGRPGPVVVDIPKDVQFAAGPYVGPQNIQHRTYRPKIHPDQDKVRAAVEMMAAAKRPVFYTGGGVVNSGREASHLLRELVRLTGLPITSTLMGLGAYPASDPQWLAMLGDCAHALDDMVRLWRTMSPQVDKQALKDWWAEIDSWRRRNCLAYRKSNEVIKPQYAIQRLYELTRGRDAYITTEVGQHQMWAAQFYNFEEPNRWMTSGGL